MSHSHYFNGYKGELQELDNKEECRINADSVEEDINESSN